MIFVSKISIYIRLWYAVEIATHNYWQIVSCVTAYVDNLSVFDKVSLGIPVEMITNNLQLLFGFQMFKHYVD